MAKAKKAAKKSAPKRKRQAAKKKESVTNTFTVTREASRANPPGYPE